MFKKRKVIIFILIFIGIIYSVSRGVEYVSMPGKAIKKINEDYYDIEINIDEKKAVVDGNEMKLSDFLGLSDKKIDNMIEDKSINGYLEDNLIGNIKFNENGVTIFNPFSTDGLSIEVEEGSGDSVIQDYGTITEYNELVENIYTLSFKNAEDTKEAYSRLKEDSRVKRVVYNYRVYQKETSASKFSVKSVRAGEEAWGVKSTGLNNYSKKMNYYEGAHPVKVAVLDSGIRGTHEVFSIDGAPNKIDYSLSYDYVNDDDDVTDDQGHGTAVAGIVAESTSNNVSIIPIKILGADGNSNFGTLLNVLRQLTRKS